MTPTHWSAPIPMLIIAFGVVLLSEIWVGVVAISENNLTLIIVAAIGAFGALAGTLISTFTAIRLSRHEAKYDEDQRKLDEALPQHRTVFVQARDGTWIANEAVDKLVDDQERER